MKYILLPFQIALGITLMWLIFKNSILPVYISQWRSAVRRQFGKVK